MVMLLTLAMAVTPLLVFADHAYAAGSADAGLTASLSPAGAKDSLSLKSVDVEGERYFFLPSGSGDSNVAYDFDTETESYKVMSSSGISSLYITSADPEKKGMDYVHADKENKVKATVTLCDENLNEVYTGAVDALKGRGNTTWTNTEKRSYQIKLAKKANLLDPKDDSQKAKKWLLLANPFDPTLVRNTIILNFARELGLEVTPEGKPVDLYYDGVYRGSYYLCEKNEIGEGRVDIADLEKANEDANPDVDFADLPIVETTNSEGNTLVYTDGIKDPEDISGGYLLEQDQVFYREEPNWFTYRDDIHVTTKAPEYVSKAQIEYLCGLLSRMYDCIMNGGKVKGSSETLFDVVDKESFVKYWLVMEWFENNDTYTSSTFFYKPAGDEKLYLGPVWDCDASIGAGNKETGESYKTWFSEGVGKFLFKDYDFRKAVKEVYKNEMRGIVYDTLLGETDGKFLATARHTLDQVKASADMNYMLWPIDDCLGSYHLKPTYEENVEEMLSWMQKRADWFDKAVMSSNFVTADLRLAQEDKPEITVNAAKRTATVKLSKAPGATNYQIAYRRAGTSKWKTVLTKGKTSYTFKKLTKGKVYEFKARARAKSNGKFRYGKYSVISRAYIAGTTSKLTAGTGSIKVSWKKVKGASGYEILYSAENDISSAQSVRVKSGKSSYTIKELEPATKYYVWFRPYKAYKGVRCPGRTVKKTATVK